MNFHDNLGTTFEFKTANSIEKNYELTEAYFKSSNFKQSGDFFRLEFMQGSKLKNGFTTNPLKWKSEFIIILSNNNVQLSCLIDTTNQLVSQTDIECWNRFIVNYENSLIQQKNLFFLNQEFVKKSKKAAVKYISYGVVITLCCLIIFGFFADYFNLNPNYVFIPSGVIPTVVLLLMKHKINQDKIL